jgi:hypothetical protein
MRALPSFLVLGAQRAGTSSMYSYLTSHPAVERATRKEVHYFDFEHERGLDWYRSHFPLRARLAHLERRLGHPVVTGEASPYYLFDPAVPTRVRASLPEARFIVLLRDPVERAISHYRHAVEDGREQLPLEAALDAEPSRMAAGPVPRWAFSYVSRGLYAEQLERWFAAFPRHRFLIRFSEDLFSSPADAVGSALEFLGLPPSPSAASYAPTNGARAAVEVAPPVRKELAARFAEPNARLADLLSCRLPWI